MKRWLAVLGLTMAIVTVQAQEDPEYRMEVGAGGALVCYEGDFNGSILGTMCPMGTLLAKYRMNPRMAWALNLSYGQLKGSSDNVETVYPLEESVDFTTKLVDACLRYEYNFWPYGTGREYRGAKPLTPFVCIGMGISYGKTDKSAVALNLPVGFGVKYKVADRLNLTAEWVMHFSGTDKLDGVKDPYGIQSSGLFKNTDCYSVLQLSLTYDFWTKCKTCHNDRE